MAEKVINIKVEDETTWKRVKRMARKAKDRALDGIEWAIDHPVEAAKVIGGTTILVKAVDGLAKSVTGPVKERRDRNRYIDTKRALTSREEQELDFYVQSGGRAADWLRMKRLMK